MVRFGKSGFITTAKGPKPTFAHIARRPERNHGREVAGRMRNKVATAALMKAKVRSWMSSD